MTHARPIPEAAQAAWPAHPAPSDTVAEPSVVPAETPVSGAGSSAKMAMGTKIGVGAAIGSAAIAAALLYVNHGRKR